MIDTVNLWLSREAVEHTGGGFLKEVSPYLLGDVKERAFKGCPFLSGRLGNLNVAVSDRYVRVGDGSMCKYHLGDNLKVMRRQDMQDCIERLSDTLHVPLSKASVTRLDWAENLVMKKPIGEYLDHLGTPARGWRNRYSETSLYYHGMNGKTFCFYDKIAEMGGETVETAWQGKNVLRLEQRYTKHLARFLCVDKVTAKDLYEQTFYARYTKEWANDFLKIPWVNDIKIDITKMKSKKDLQRMGILSLCKECGGQNVLLASFKERQDKGELTRKQAFDLRQEINEACKVGDGFTEVSEEMEELQRKVKEVARYSR